MKLAYISADARGETDRLLSQCADWMLQNGRDVRGVVKLQQVVDPADHHCDMDLRVLPDGPLIRITQSLGEGSSGCRLDPRGIVQAVAAVEDRGFAPCDLFIVNKFGPEESIGRGFCAAIGTCLEQEIPVLVGVTAGGRADFEAFAGGMAQHLPPFPEEIRKWCQMGA